MRTSSHVDFNRCSWMGESAGVGADLGSGSTSVQTWGQTWGAGPLQAQAQAQTHPRPRRLDQVCLLSEASANQTQD